MLMGKNNVLLNNVRYIDIYKIAGNVISDRYLPTLEKTKMQYAVFIINVYVPVYVHMLKYMTNAIVVASMLRTISSELKLKIGIMGDLSFLDVE